MFTAEDRRFMQQALALAEGGLYTATPNPRVGAVVVRNGLVVGEGFHARAGAPHAEVVALDAAGPRAQGGTLYVTLEPCNHHGRTPPCTARVIAAGVKRVVAAMRDPNPEVDGKGFAALRAAGLQVETGLLELEATELNIGFVSRMTRGRPWVRLKIAASLDGKTALANGKSQWITGAEARRDGHHWRARACAVLTGIGTVLEDDPQLTVRNVETPRQPLRVVVDSRMETPPAARVLAGGNALIAAAVQNEERQRQFAVLGIETLMLPDARGKVELQQLMAALAQRGVNEVHVEAGWKLNGSLIREGCVDELLVYLAPCLLGDTALGMAALPGLEDLEARRRLQITDVLPVGSDLRLLARMVAG
ncbi:MAG: bifunctional diaminohydroxyphosphoribosylaminopyrimidine deaminase/5-amino-6-(5-phosphoribosylamino)uracil reductase RibD [Burkholderiales bacterium]